MSSGNGSNLKSSNKDLEARGFVAPESITNLPSVPAEELMDQLQSQTPTVRTRAAMFLTRGFQSNSIDNPDSREKIIRRLITSLQVEAKLYSKIAISEALVASGSQCIPLLLPLLGTIGNNRHQTLPTKPFDKKSYPLPRDIVARILIRLSTPVLFFISENHENLTDNQIPEAIDIIGHISFNSYSLYENILSLLLKWYRDKIGDEIIVWKILRAFSAFNTPEVQSILLKTIKENQHPAFVWEARRSLNLHKLC